MFSNNNHTVMKKVLLVLSSVIIIVVIILLFFVRSSSGYRSIYLIPDDAVFIVETSDPIEAWDQIIYSKAWDHFSNNVYFKELNEDILSYDSLISSSKFLLKLIGKKAVTMSQHNLGNGKYEYIYVIDIGKVAKYKSPEKLINSVLGKNYEVTSRDYKNTKIVELYDIEESDNYFMAFTEGKLIFSFEPKLVERAIDASEEKIIGRDMKYLDVQSQIGNKGLFSIYFKFENLSETMKSLSSDAYTSYANSTRYMKYMGILFDIDEEGLLSLEGYASLDDTAPPEYLGMLVEGDKEVESASVIPLRIASLAKINFKNAGDYFNKAMKSMSSEEYEEYMETVAKTEKKLKISLEENLFSWMDKEIILLQTQPSNLGRDNEFAAVLHASDSALAADNLEFLWKQIKKNTPVKIKSINYKGYKIDYVAFPGIIKALFGKTLDKLEKPYFTQLGKNVILSNHPQTLKNIIDDYLNESTLSTSVSFYNFSKNLEDNSSALMYFEPPVLFQNLRAFLDAESWTKLKKNKKYITCFEQGAIQVNQKDELIHFLLKAQYQPEIEEFKKQYYNSSEIFSMFSYSPQITLDTIPEKPKDTLPKIIISDLDAKKYEEFYDDGSKKIEVELKDGLKHGNIREYYPNGELKLKGQYDEDVPVGKWKYYNEEGKLIKTDKY